MIKKKLSLFILTALLLPALYISCAPETPHSAMSERYIYFGSAGGELISSCVAPQKLNPVTGTVTSVCVDPLCNHQNGCPFYNSQGCMASGGLMFFVSSTLAEEQSTGALSGSAKICAYDMISGEARELAEYTDALSLVFAYENYLYYAKAERDEGGAGVRYMLYRADGVSGKVIEIDTESKYGSDMNGVSTSDYPNIYTVDGGLIYWMAPSDGGYEFYTTDLAGKNKNSLDFGGNPRVMNGVYCGGWAYYTENINAGNYADCETELERRKFLNERVLRRVRLDGGEDELVCGNIADFMIHGDTIYFTVCEDNPLSFKYNNSEYFNLFGGKIYAMDTDGGGVRLICEAGEYDLGGYQSAFLGAVSEGDTDYIALSFRDYVENDYYESGYDYNISPSALIVNAATGEYGVSK